MISDIIFCKITHIQLSRLTFSNDIDYVHKRQMIDCYTDVDIVEQNCQSFSGARRCQGVRKRLVYCMCKQTISNRKHTWGVMKVTYLYLTLENTY